MATSLTPSSFANDCGVIDSVVATTGRSKSFTQHAAGISGKPAH